MAGVQILPPTSEEKVTQLQKDGHRHSWALDMDGPWLTRSSSALLTGFVFIPDGCPYPYTLLTKKLGGGDGFVADNPTMKQVSTVQVYMVPTASQRSNLA